MDLRKALYQITLDCYLEKTEDVLININDFIEEAYKYIDPKSEQQLLSVINIIMMAIEKRDSIMIGDCLEYGIKPLLEGKSIQEELFLKSNLLLPNVKEKIFYCPSYTNELVLCIKNGDNTDVCLNSIFSPQNEVDYWLEGITNLKSTTPVICLFGLGTGLFAEALLKKINDSCVLLIYEPQKDILDYCLKSGENTDCDDAERQIKNRIEKILSDKRVHFIVDDIDEFSKWLPSNIDYTGLMGLVVVRHNGYDKLYPKIYIRFLQEINSYRSMKYINKNTIGLFKDKMLDNLFKNFCMYKKANMYYELGEILPRDIPVIIVSAGPSLEKNIDYLHMAKGHCLIFAVDTAINYLLKNEIIPDITITVDPDKRVENYSNVLSHEIPCVFDVTANSNIVNQHKTRCFVFNTSNIYMSMLFEKMGKKLSMAPNGGSVATSVFRILYELNQKKIILVGQDLAFVNGATHAGGVDGNTQHEKMYVEGVNGDQILSRADWVEYLKWFEMAIDTIKTEQKDIEVIDATEGGAKIHGSKIMTVKEAINSCKDSNGNLPNYDFGNELEKLELAFSEEEYSLLLRKRDESIEKLKEISLKSDEAIRICNTLLKGVENGTVSSTYVDKEKKKISKINEWCSNTLVFPLINDFLITDIVDEISMLQLAEGDRKTKEINGIKIMKISFEAIEKAAENIFQKAKECSTETKNA